MQNGYLHGFYVFFLGPTVVDHVLSYAPTLKPIIEVLGSRTARWEWGKSNKGERPETFTTGRNFASQTKGVNKPKGAAVYDRILIYFMVYEIITI